MQIKRFTCIHSEKTEKHLMASCSVGLDKIISDNVMQLTEVAASKNF